MFKETDSIEELIKQKDELIQSGKYSTIEVLTEFQKMINSNKDVVAVREILKPINIQRITTTGDYLCKILYNKDNDPYMCVTKDDSVSIKKEEDFYKNSYINIDIKDDGKVGITYV